MIRMSQLQNFQGDFAGSETSIVEALPYLNEVDSVYKTSAYNQLGLAYERQMDFKSAADSYNKSFNFTSSESQKLIVKNNLAVLAIMQKNFLKASKILFPLLQNEILKKESETHARILDNLGCSLYKLGDGRGINMMLQSFKIRKEIDDDFGLATSALNLSEYYANVDSHLAKKYALISFEKAKILGNADAKLSALESLIKNTNFAESKNYSLEHLQLNDSLNKARQSAKNQFAKIRYDNRVTREENLELKVEHERQSNRIAIVLLVFLFVIIIGIILYVFLKKKHRRDKILDAYKAEVKISGRIHDELANDIHNAMTYTVKQDFVREEKKEFLLTSLESLYDRARDISKDLSRVETGVEFPAHLREMLSGHSDTKTHVIINGFKNLQWEKVPEDVKIAVYRVLQELMINMRKHSGASNVLLHFGTSQKNLSIEYSDNGVGIDASKRFLKNGLHNVENRIKAVGGKIIFDPKPKNGLHITVICPVENL